MASKSFKITENVQLCREFYGRRKLSRKISHKSKVMQPMLNKHLPEHRPRKWRRQISTRAIQSKRKKTTTMKRRRMEIMTRQSRTKTKGWVDGWVEFEASLFPSWGDPADKSMHLFL